MQIGAFCKPWAGRALLCRTAGAERTAAWRSTKLRIMRLTAFLILAACLRVSGGSYAQTITFSGVNVPLEQVFEGIKQQTGYVVFCNYALLEKAKPVTLRVSGMPLPAFLNEILKDRQLKFSIRDKTILVSRNTTATPSAMKASVAQLISIIGQVTDGDGNPLPGASVKIKASGKGVLAGAEGRFSIDVADGDELVISFIGFSAMTFRVKDGRLLSTGRPGGSLLNTPEGIVIKLSATEAGLEAVTIVSTGYQQLPKERATGSFVHVDNKTFNQQVGTDILSRLEAVANGIMVDRNSSGTPNIMIRGLSTIQGPKEVLVVVDNFPYDGDINNINPNDVEGITILKDAAAASIWGARAGNGVIVITTKKGNFNQPLNLSLNANVTVGSKPDLFMAPQISSADFVDLEIDLFGRGFYNSRINAVPSTAVLSPVVELLIKRRNASPAEQPEIDAQIDRYRHLDIRNDMEKYLYRNFVNQQYALQLSGGNNVYSWSSSANFDKNTGSLHEGANRVNLAYKSTFRPVKKLQFTTALYYTQRNDRSGSAGYGSITQNGNGFLPYAQLADENGQALPIDKQYRTAWKNSLPAGLLDWNYYPLEDYKHNVTTTRLQDMILNGGVSYALPNGLSADVKYQYEQQSSAARSLAGIGSYTARGLINLFTEVRPDGSLFRPLPAGGILETDNNNMESHQVRGQLMFNRVYGKHGISAIAGGEMRTANTKSLSGGYYGYNEDILTVASVDHLQSYPYITGTGSGFITDLNTYITDRTRRFVSLFANAAYTYKERYTLSSSLRTDASNLFGLKTNDQWNPFFSTGLSWLASSENFYQVSWLPVLKIRGSYGFSGNVDPAMTAVTTLAYLSFNNPVTQTRQASINNYYNPELKWETSRQLNLGMDFGTRGSRITGSVEYFHKNGMNLFGNALLDYTAGAGFSITKNVASMKGKGIDIELNTVVVDREFKWRSILNFSWYKDEVVDFYLTSQNASSFVTNAGLNSGRPAKKGLPVNSVFSYRWAGLDPLTGDPQGYINGHISKDYAALTGSATKIDDLVFHGSAIPTKYGSFNNSFSYRNFTLNVSMTYKLGYYFRRAGIQYGSLFSNWLSLHSDYAKRWQQPGDELHTHVPSMVYPEVSARTRFYSGSEALIERGDHIRFQYINLAYRFDRSPVRWKVLRGVEVYGNVNNVGLLWRANKENIDPDFVYGYARYGISTPRSFSLGLRASLN